MRGSNTFRQAVLVAVLAGCLFPIPAVSQVVFEPIRDPAFVGFGPGPDGFIGTDDDVVDANNTAGTVSYGIRPSGPLLYSEPTTTINEPYVFENGVSTITDFSTGGPLLPGDPVVDDPDACFEFILQLGCIRFFPHEMVIDLQVVRTASTTSKASFPLRPASSANRVGEGASFFGGAKTRFCCRRLTRLWRAISTS